MFPKTVSVLISCVFITSASLLFAADNKTTNGPYLGQLPPGDEAVLFAPGIISDGFNNRDMAMTPDGTEFYYAVNMRNFDLSTILAMYRTDNGWGGPRVAPFAQDQNSKFLEPAISPDGSKFFYVASERDGIYRKA